MMWPLPPAARARGECRGKRYYGEGRRGAGMGGAGRARTVGCGAEGIAEARRIVSGGGLIAFPTDTVYGIGCDPFDGRAVGLVYEAKGRPASKPLPVLGASAAGLSRIAALEGRAARLAARFWPGPLTIVARAAASTPPPPGRPPAPQLVSGSGGIAVRVPAGRCVSGLLAACGPLVGTSANLSGRQPCRTAAECAEQLGDRVSLVVDGGEVEAAAGAAEAGVSTVVEVGGDGGLRIVREGLVGRGDLERTR